MSEPTIDQNLRLQALQIALGYITHVNCGDEQDLIPLAAEILKFITGENTNV